MTSSSPIARARSARGAAAICELAGYGSTCDAYHRVQIAPDVEECVRSMQLALEDELLVRVDINIGDSRVLGQRLAHPAGAFLAMDVRRNEFSGVHGDLLCVVVARGEGHARIDASGARGGMRTAATKLAAEWFDQSSA